jgi:hypothetical protein
MRQVVHLQGITQCAVLQEFGFVLVLAQGALVACTLFLSSISSKEFSGLIILGDRIADSLEALIPSGKSSEAVSKTPQRLSGKQQVLFFHVGKVGDTGDASARTLVICSFLPVPF